LQNFNQGFGSQPSGAGTGANASTGTQQATNSQGFLNWMSQGAEGQWPRPPPQQQQPQQDKQGFLKYE